MKQALNFLFSLKSAMILLAVLSICSLSSCKKEKEEAAKKNGKMIFYTMLDGSEFDRIEVFIDGKSVGNLILPHIKRPECGDVTAANVVNIVVPEGEHTWYAKQFKGGVEIDDWYERPETVSAYGCRFIKLEE